MSIEGKRDPKEPPFQLMRDWVVRQPWRRIMGPDGKQYGPTFGDISGPREAEPWLRALNAAYQLGVEETAQRCAEMAQTSKGYPTTLSAAIRERFGLFDENV